MASSRLLHKLKLTYFSVWVLFTVDIIVGDDWFYVPKCSQGCSNQIHTDDIEYFDQKNDIESCKAAANGLHSTIDSSSPLTYIMIEDYSTVFHDNTSDGTYMEYAGPWSAVNLTYQFNPNVAGLVTGVAFTMTDVSPEKDSDLFVCRGYSFNSPLGLDEIQDDRANQYTHFFNCLRGQWPGHEYQFTIRVISTGAQQLYKFYHRIPACSFKPTDMQCRSEYGYDTVTSIELPRLWKPQYFQAESMQYGEICVRIELPPEDYNINIMELAVTDQFESVQTIHVAFSTILETVVFGRQIRYIQVNLTNVTPGEDKSVQLTPTPNPNTCVIADGRGVACSTTQSKYFTVYDNPCKSEICGLNEICKPVTAGPDHTCVCREGYIMVGTECTENECLPTNPCGSAGECSMTSNGYTCDCIEEYINHGGYCQYDPCDPDPCAPHGICQLTQRSRSLSYNCDCDENYKYNLTTCIENVCLTSKPCGSHVKSCNVLSDPVCTCQHNYVYRKGRGCIASPGILAVSILGCIVLLGIIILVFFCWKKDKREWLGEQISQLSLCSRCCRSNAIVCECPKCGTKIAWEHGKSTVHGYELVGDPPFHPMPSDTDTGISVVNRITTRFDDDKCIEMEHTDVDPVGPVWIKSNPRLISDISLVKMTKLLILSADDNPAHSGVVDVFADFLKMEKNMFFVIRPCWYELDIAARGWDGWFKDKVMWADKVIMIASGETRVGPDGHCISSDRNFVKAINHIIDQCQHGDSHKYQLAYFEYSDVNADIPPLLKHLPKYKLMKHMEALFFKLHGIEKYDVGKERMAPWMTEDLYYIESSEGASLLEAMQTMTNAMINNDIKQYQKCDVHEPQTTVAVDNSPDSKIPFFSLNQVIAKTALSSSHQEIEPSCRTSRRFLGHSGSVSSSDSSCGFEEAFTEITGASPHDVT